eukprot:4223988-Pleurochrysis_carterae.AAC.1
MPTPPASSISHAASVTCRLPRALSAQRRGLRAAAQARPLFALASALAPAVPVAGGGGGAAPGGVTRRECSCRLRRRRRPRPHSIKKRPVTSPVTDCTFVTAVGGL